MTTDVSVPTSETPSRPLSALPAGFSSWIATAVATAVAYVLVSHGLMQTYAGWQVPLFVGAVAGLAASSLLQGALVGGAVAAVGLVTLPPSTLFGVRLGLGASLLGVLVTLVAAFAVGAIRERSAGGRATVDVALSALLVAWLILNLWAPIFSAGEPLSGYGTLKASTIREVPQPHRYVNDDALYRRIYYLMHHGEGYYRAFHDAWVGLGQSPAFPTSVTSVRLPTLFWIWAALPADPFSIVILFLAAVSVGMVAAAAIAGQLAGARAAPLAAAALGAYAMGSAITVYVTYVDLPAMCVALVGIALLLRGRITDDARWVWAAAVAITCAALTREILIYVAVLALLSALFEPARRRWRQIVPWIASLALFGIGYAAHARIVRSMIVAQSSAITYWKGSPAFAFDSVTRFADAMNGRGVLLAMLFVLGLVAAVASRRRAGLSFALFASAALLAPVLTMLKVGNPGIDAAGNQINYWGNLYVPIALALWPAWVLVLRGERRELPDTGTHTL